MGTLPGLPLDGNIKFSRDGKFLENQLTAHFDVAAGNVPGLAQALVQNRPFPAGKISYANVGVRVSGDTPAVRFAGDRGVVSFGGGVGVRAGFGTATKAVEILADLDPDDQFLQGIGLADEGVARYVALNWGYDIQAAVKGCVALGYGASLKFGADGQSNGFFAVIRGFAGEPGARDAIQSTFDSWKLPRHVQSVQDLQPGTWIVAEVDGEFAATLGVEFGYDYTWLRNVSLQGLRGDIGLRIAASAAINMGFNASGKFLVVAARESMRETDQVVRVRLFKMARKGWNFAMNSCVGATTKTGKFLPGELDDFVAGILGLHGAQLVKDLQKFRAWMDPTVPLEKKLLGFVTQYAAKRLQGDSTAKMNDARAAIQGVLKNWQDLPHAVSSLVWTEVRKGGEPAAVFEQSLKLIANGTNDQIKATVTEALSDVEFFRSPIGRFLESVSLGPLLTLATNQSQIIQVREAAKQVLGVLDGKVLEELAVFVDQRLNAKVVQNILNVADLKNTDPWLTAKLTEFLGKDLDLDGIREVQKTLHFLDSKAAELYTAARSTLNRTWTAAAVYEYSSATTKTALLDISFDFGANPALGDSLISVIDGNWNSILLGKPPGVKINSAVLTHGVQRHSHFDVTLPYYNTALDKFNQATASMTFASDDGGVYLYELTADDSITRRRKWQSIASVSSKIAVVAAPNVNVFPSPDELADSSSYSYTLLMLRKNLRVTELEQQVGPLILEYFPKAFAAAGGRASIGEWIADLDKHADAVENNGTFNLGNVLLRLDVALPGKCVAAWFGAPGRKDPRDRYQRMSRNIQRALRRLIPLCYFDEPRKYAAAELAIAAQILVYSSLPVSTGIKVKSGKPTIDADAKSLFWQYDDPREDSLNERRAMIFSGLTQASLRDAMRKVKTILERNPDVAKFASDYDDTQIGRLCSLAYRQNDRDTILMKLLRNESMTIDLAVDAGLALADFRQKNVTDPEAAMAALAEFGGKITETFNSHLGDLIGGPMLRALGSIAFLEAARAFDDSLAEVSPVARLDVTLLRSTAPGTWREDFLAGKDFDPHVISLEQPIVNV